MPLVQNQLKGWVGSGAMSIIKKIGNTVVRLGGATELVRTRIPDWEILFITDSRGIQVGRANIHNGELYSYRKYGSHWADRGPLDEQGRFWLKFDFLMDTGVLLLDEHIDVAQGLAENEHRKVKAQKNKWREDNPKLGTNKKRPKLLGPGIGSLTRQYVYEVFGANGKLAC